MILTLENPLLFNSVRNAVPICASAETLTRAVGYVGLLFWGSFYAQTLRESVSQRERAETYLDRNSIRKDAMAVEALYALQQIIGICNGIHIIVRYTGSIMHVQMLT